MINIKTANELRKELDRLVVSAKEHRDLARKEQYQVRALQDFLLAMNIELKAE